MKELRLFQSLRLLRVLNVVGVGAVLASASAALTRFFDLDTTAALLGNGPTLVIGMVWAATWRERRTLAFAKERPSWKGSALLAMLSAAITCSFLMAKADGRVTHAGTVREALGHLLMGALGGATFGAIWWVPVLIATRIVFGPPLTTAQAMAARGHAGEERGERIVGFTSFAAASVIALGHTTQIAAPANDAILVPFGFVALAMLTSGPAAVLAMIREMYRERFVKRAIAGELTDYRVNATEQGRVVV